MDQRWNDQRWNARRWNAQRWNIRRLLGGMAWRLYRSGCRRSSAAVAAAMLAVVIALPWPAGEAAQLILAMSGDAHPDGGGAALAGVALPTLNNAGQVVLQVTLAQGSGDVTAETNAAVWFVDGGHRESLARNGAGDLAGGASFASFAAVSIADDGDVVLKGAVDDGKQGFWRFARNGSRSTLALTGTTGVPGAQLQNAQFQSFGFQLIHSPRDGVAFNARMVRGLGGVDSLNSRGVWRNLDGATELLLREYLHEAPGIPSAKFLVPAVEGLNNDGQAALLGSLVNDFGGVTTLDALGVFRIGGPPGSDQLIARRNSGEAPGVSGGLFGGFSDLRINAGGAISFVGELRTIGDVTSENDRGLWLFDGTTNRLVARTGAGGAPGVAGASFETLEAPLLNDAGQLLFAGRLKTGVGGVTANAAKGVWIADGTSAGALVARSGVGGVPGAPAAKFAEFGALAFNADGVAAIAATLEIGAGGVAAGTDQGLWLMDATGDGRLVARRGDVVAGRTVADLEFLGGSGGGDGRQRALNQHGQLAYRAIFTNGDEAALLYTPELRWRTVGNGNWDDAFNWTLGITPAGVHAVEVFANSPTTLIGPSGDVTVRRLQLGGGNGETTLEMPESGTLSVTEGLFLAANGKLAGKGTLVGAVVNAGSTSPGASTGVLAIDGDYRQESTGRLTIEIGGADNSSPVHKQFDQLLVLGHAALGGTLDVSLVNGYVPAVGDVFPILTATGGMTSFDSLHLPTLPGDRVWAASTSANTLALSVVAASTASPADFNGDGYVDGDDLAAWATGYGGAASGDADGSGHVDGADFLVWQREFTGRAGLTLQTNVPEAGAAMQAGAIILAGLAARRRRLSAAAWT